MNSSWDAYFPKLEQTCPARLLFLVGVLRHVVPLGGAVLFSPTGRRHTFLLLLIGLHPSNLLHLFSSSVVFKLPVYAPSLSFDTLMTCTTYFVCIGKAQVLGQGIQRPLYINIT